MGFFADVAKTIRKVLVGDKERLAAEIAQGSTTSVDNSGGLVNNFGSSHLSEYLYLDTDLISRYVDYEEMDDYPEISAAIDIYADDTSQPETQINRTVWVTSKDDNVQTTLDDLFHRVLRLDEEIWEIARTLVKYGNDFEELLITKEGVRGFNFLPAPTVRRVEGNRGELFGFVQDMKGRFNYTADEFQQLLKKRADQKTDWSDPASASNSNEFQLALEPFEVVHFRLRGKHRRSLYGHSVLESARFIWKRLMLLEDAALIYRLQRAPERFAFYVDVGDLPPAEALAYVNRVRQQYKKRKFMNPSTGKMDLKFDPLSSDDDFFVPIRKGQEGARIEVLGAPAWQHMEDIEYFRDKLFAAIKVPKAYLGQEQGVGRAVLSSEDVRFARTVLRVQREIKNGLMKVCRVHLAALNIAPESVEYEIHMNVPSAILELAQLEVRNARADLAGRMKEFVSLHWMLANVFGMSDEEIEQITRQREEESVANAVKDARGQAAAQKEMPVIPGENGQSPVTSPQTDFGAEGIIRPRLTRPVSKLFSSRLDPEKGLRLTGRNGISERELFAGSREAEKRADGKLEKLLKSDQEVVYRLNQLGGLLQEMRALQGQGRRR